MCDLPLTSANGASLNNLAQSLSKAIKDTGEENFVGVKTSGSKELETKLNIVKRIIEIRLAARDKAKDAQSNSEKRNKLIAAKARKEDIGIDSMSMEDIDKALEALKD